MSPVALGPLRDMLGYLLLLASTAAGLAALLAYCCKPKKLPPPEDSDSPDKHPLNKLRTRPTRPALDYTIFHRY